MKHLTLLCYFIYLLFQATTALATTSEVYRFERLWPLLPPPWHFGNIWNLAISPQGHLYVVDALRIQKFDNFRKVVKSKITTPDLTTFEKLSNLKPQPRFDNFRKVVKSKTR